MALWKPFRGSRAALDAVEKHDGYVYFCTDDGSLFFDYADADGNLQRKQINAKDAETLTGLSLDEIKAYVQVQADFNQTDETKPDYIKNKPQELPEEELLAWLDEANIVEPIASPSGEIYVNNNNEIYIL